MVDSTITYMYLYRMTLLYESTLRLVPAHEMYAAQGKDVHTALHVHIPWNTPQRPAASVRNFLKPRSH